MKRLFVPFVLSAALLSGCDPSTTVSPLPGSTGTSTTTSLSVPSSIDATGGADVSAAFAAFVASAPDGSVISLARDARYRMEQTLTLDDRRNLTFEGNGATIFATTQADRNRANIRVRGGANIVFRNLIVKGANPQAGKNGPDPWVATWEAQHAFDILGVTRVRLVNVTATDTHGDFVHLSRWKGKWSDDIVIRGSHFERSGRQGIALVAVRNVVIENNSLSDLRRATFDLEPDNAPGTGVDNVVIRNNRVGPGRLMFVAAAGHGPVNNITVQGNRLSGQAMQVFVNDLAGGRRTNWKVLDNVSDLPLSNPHGSAMRLWRLDDVQVRGNRQPFVAGRNMVGANIHASCALDVEANDYPNSVGQARITGTNCPK